MYLLGIDIGTSGTKTALFDTAGNAVASATYEYPLYSPKNGYAEQSPADWWNAVVSGIKSVLAKSGANKSDIKGIGLSGQMHGLVMLDKAGNVIRNSIIWCDQRTAKEADEVNARVGHDKLIEITANPAITGFTAAKILWVRNNEPENFGKCAHILLPKDYIRYMLTGEFATEVSDASGMQLLSVPDRQWSDFVLDKLGIDKSLLGKVYESPEVTGAITKQVSELTGLAEGTPVVGGAGDNAAAAIGTGVAEDGKAFTTIGSSGVVFTHTSKISIDKLGRVHTFCAAVPGEWHVMGVTQAAGLSLKWYRDNFGHGEMETAAQMGTDPYVLMSSGAELSPIGANKLLYLPYLNGERTPHLDPNARGVFFGLSTMHTKRDFVRAIMEGVTYSLTDCVNIIRGMGTITDMAACGGGAASPLWRQMLADNFSCPVKTMQSKEGPALGVALLAGVGTGVWKSVPEACRATVKSKDTQPPEDANTAEYRKFHEIYKQLYKDLKGTYAALASV
ncbi:xylulokinase [Clostridia bacterium]|nr:xylulokinase [Clostridia bacterium]